MSDLLTTSSDSTILKLDTHKIDVEKSGIISEDINGTVDIVKSLVSEKIEDGNNQGYDIEEHKIKQKIHLFKNVFKRVRLGKITDFSEISEIFKVNFSNIKRIDPDFDFKFELKEYYVNKYLLLLEDIGRYTNGSQQRGFKKEGRSEQLELLKKGKNNIEKFGKDFLGIDIEDFIESRKIEKNNKEMERLMRWDYLSKKQIDNFIHVENGSSRAKFIEKIEEFKKELLINSNSSNEKIGDGFAINDLLDGYFDLKKDYIDRYSSGERKTILLNNLDKHINNIKTKNINIDYNNKNINDLNYNSKVLWYIKGNKRVYFSINNLLTDIRIFGPELGIPIFEKCEIGKYINNLVKKELSIFITNKLNNIEEILYHNLVDYDLKFINHDKETGIVTEKIVQHLLMSFSKYRGYDVSFIKGEYLDQKIGTDLMIYYTNKKGMIKRQEYQITIGKKISEKLNGVDYRNRLNKINGIHSKSDLLVLSKFKDYFTNFDIKDLAFGKLHSSVPDELSKLIFNKLDNLYNK